MKCFVATVFTILIATTVAHPPTSSDESDRKPITELTDEARESRADYKIFVRIFYEALCPDSRKFVADFGREYYVYRKYMDVDFVPFGRAKSLDADGNQFECHHGPKECDANRAQSCGLKYLSSQDARQQFVVCQMRPEAEPTGKECLEEAGGNWDEVSKCIEGDEGKKLQLEAERKTKEVSKPKLLTVPTITFNNEYNADLQSKAVTRFSSALCELLKDKQLTECE